MDMAQLKLEQNSVACTTNQNDMFVTTFYPKKIRDVEGVPEKDWPMMNIIYHAMEHGKEERRLIAALKPSWYCRSHKMDGNVGTSKFIMEL